MINRRNLVKSSLIVAPCLFSGANQAFANEVPYDLDCGVSSGDPSHDGFVIWTRLPPKARDSQSGRTTVYCEVSKDPTFAADQIVFRATLHTDSGRDYTVKARVRGLAPKTFYFYRFYNNAPYASLIGRSKTTPAPDDQNTTINIAFVSCQKMSDGIYSAYRNLATENVDAVLHLGDHIYEVEPGRPWKVDPLNGSQAKTLADFRAKYRYYLSDPAYREVRRLFPWIDIWDDHEVFNDYAGSVDRAKNKELVSNAYQAFAEYMPFEADLEFESDGTPTMQVYRKISFGDRLDVIATDLRQYRSPSSGYGGGRRHDSSRTLLGSVQKSWLKDQLSQSRAQWKIVMSEVMMGPLRLGLKSAKHSLIAEKMFGDSRHEERGIYLNLDQWDGFTTERAEVLNHIRDESIKNVLIVAGDIHAAFDSVLYSDSEQTEGPGVAIEIVTSSVSSSTIGRIIGPALCPLANWLLKVSNPQIKDFDIKRSGYAVLSLRPDGTQVRHMLLDNVLTPGLVATREFQKWIPDGQSTMA